MSGDGGIGTGRRGSAVAPPRIGDITIYLAQESVDFRLGINGLSVLVEATLRFDPFSRNLFCFSHQQPPGRSSFNNMAKQSRYAVCAAATRHTNL